MAALAAQRGPPFRVDSCLEGSFSVRPAARLPPCLHLMVTPAHARIVEPFLADLREATAKVASDEATGTPGMAAMYGAIAAAPQKGFVTDFLVGVLDEWTQAPPEDGDP